VQISLLPKPSFVSTGSVSLIMMGGPHTMATVFAAAGANCSTMWGTKPTLPVQPGFSPPRSTVMSPKDD
jgi:hypothetical protein